VKKGGKDQMAGKVKPLGPVVGRSGDDTAEFTPVGRPDIPAPLEFEVVTASRIEASISDIRGYNTRTVESIPSRLQVFVKPFDDD
jgi:hypothetical protein